MPQKPPSSDTVLGAASEILNLSRATSLPRLRDVLSYLQRMTRAESRSSSDNLLLMNALGLRSRPMPELDARIQELCLQIEQIMVSNPKDQESREEIREFLLSLVSELQKKTPRNRK